MADEQQPQIISQQGSGGFAVPMRTGLEPSVAATVLKPDDVLTQFENMVRGYSYKGYNRWERDETKTVYMNEEGISFTMGILRLMHSRITTLGNKGEIQSFDELYTLLANYAIWLRINARKLNFNVSYFGTFMALLITTATSTYSRALLGDDKSFLSGLPNEGLRTNTDQQRQQGANRLFPL